MTKWSEERLLEHMEYMRSFSRGPDSTVYSEQEPDQGPESKFQAKILKWASEHGYACFHDRSRRKNIRGWPDITLCLPKGRVIFIELKSAKGILRKEQKQIRQQMVFLGHEHYVVKSYKRFLEVAHENKR